MENALLTRIKLSNSVLTNRKDTSRDNPATVAIHINCSRFGCWNNITQMVKIVSKKKFEYGIGPKNDLRRFRVMIISRGRMSSNFWFKTIIANIADKSMKAVIRYIFGYVFSGSIVTLPSVFSSSKL